MFLPRLHRFPRLDSFGRHWRTFGLYGCCCGIVISFAIAGGADLAWHTAFGIEQNIDILFSPSHIGLIATMLVIVTTPVRAMWADRSLRPAPGLRRLLPAVLSACLAATLVLLFVQYANALVFSNRAVVNGLSQLDEGLTAHLVGSLAVTNLILLGTLLTLARRWVLPLGTATLLYLATGGLSLAVAGFRNGLMITAFVLSGVVVDLLARWLRPVPGRLTRYRTFAGLAAFVTWAVYVGTAYVSVGREVDGGIGSVELTTGAPLVQAGLAVLLGILLEPSAPLTEVEPRP